ncbi:MAG: hypothetical protein ACJA2S_005652, partial [Cyclobacteriaceae bacterium]
LLAGPFLASLRKPERSHSGNALKTQCSCVLVTNEDNWGLGVDFTSFLKK